MLLMRMPIPAAAIRLPSTVADKNSIFPWPYGWSSSLGLAARYRLYNANEPATTFTSDSSASVNIAFDEVRNQAINLMPDNSTVVLNKKACMRKLLLIMLLFCNNKHFRNYFLFGKSHMLTRKKYDELN